jgi:hypothetical protein
VICLPLVWPLCRVGGFEDFSSHHPCLSRDCTLTVSQMPASMTPFCLLCLPWSLSCNQLASSSPFTFCVPRLFASRHLKQLTVLDHLPSIHLTNYLSVYLSFDLSIFPAVYMYLMPAPAGGRVWHAECGQLRYAAPGCDQPAGCTHTRRAGRQAAARAARINAYLAGV